MSAWVYTDADNTLWDTNALFAQAQLALLSAAESFSGARGPGDNDLEYVRQFDQAIAASHHSKLRYPPALLLRALQEGLKGSNAKDAAQIALSQGAVPSEREANALASYACIVSSTPPLLPTVREGLELARRRSISVYVITEGPAETTHANLKELEIESLTSGVLSAQKTPELYTRLKQRAAPHKAFMIGDQPDRDIRFAKEAGITPILVLGRFRPVWFREADVSLADVVVESFLQAIEWVTARPTAGNQP